MQITKDMFYRFKANAYPFEPYFVEGQYHNDRHDGFACFVGRLVDQERPLPPEGTLDYIRRISYYLPILTNLFGALQLDLFDFLNQESLEIHQKYRKSFSIGIFSISRDYLPNDYAETVSIRVNDVLVGTCTPKYDAMGAMTHEQYVTTGILDGVCDGHSLTDIHTTQVYVALKNRLQDIDILINRELLNYGGVILKKLFATKTKKNQFVFIPNTIVSRYSADDKDLEVLYKKMTNVEWVTHTLKHAYEIFSAQKPL